MFQEVFYSGDHFFELLVMLFRSCAEVCAKAEGVQVVGDGMDIFSEAHSATLLPKYRGLVLRA